MLYVQNVFNGFSINKRRARNLPTVESFRTIYKKYFEFLILVS